MFPCTVPEPRKCQITNKIVSIVDDEVDITKLFQDAICGNLNGISVVSFTNPVTALSHFRENK
jgi:hypothetical protein